jgi:hypothetical protein
MQKRRRVKPTFALATLALLAGCKEDLLDDMPDAAVDAAIDALPMPAGDFSCVGVPSPTTAPDPLLVRGNAASLGGITVEVHDATTDALLFTKVSDGTSADRMGKYSNNVATGGTAPRLYRHLLADATHLDTYTVDGIPASFSYELGSVFLTDQATQGFYNTAGVTRDRAKGTMHVDVFDCFVAPTDATHIVEGATVDPPTGATVVYVDPNGIPDRSLTATTSRGTVLILNVTPGFADVTIHAGPVTYRSWPVRVFANTWTNGPRHP